MKLAAPLTSAQAKNTSCCGNCEERRHWRRNGRKRSRRRIQRRISGVLLPVCYFFHTWVPFCFADAYNFLFLALVHLYHCHGCCQNTSANTGCTTLLSFSLSTYSAFFPLLCHSHLLTIIPSLPLSSLFSISMALALQPLSTSLIPPLCHPCSHLLDAAL